MFDFIQTYLSSILGIILATKVAAELIVNLTPTPVDNTYVGYFYSFIEKAAGIWSTTAKELPGEREALTVEKGTTK